MNKIKRLFFGASLKTRIMTFMIFIILFLLVFLILFTYIKISDISKKQFSSLSSDMVNQVNNNVTQYLNQIDNLTYMISNNSEVRQGLSYPSEDYALQKLSQYSLVRGYLQTLSNALSNHNAVLVVGINGEIYYYGSKMLDYNYDFTNNSYIAQLHSGNSLIFLTPHHPNYLLESTGYVFSVLRAIYDNVNGELLGYVIIDTDYSYFDALMGNHSLSGESDILITNGKTIICSWDKNKFLKPLDPAAYAVLKKSETLSDFVSSESGRYFYTSGKIDITGWNIISINSLATYNAKTMSILSYMLVISLICLIISFFIASLIASAITKPVKKLGSLMKSVEQGRFDVQFDVKYDDEISELGRIFNVMIVRIKNLIDTVYVSNLVEKDAIIAALQSQINPHFLYNTLQSISDMAEESGQEEISETVKCLASNFRYSIGSKLRYVRLYDELENVRNYISLELIRNSGRFRFLEEVSEELLNIRLPRFILQPLVENSLMHGIYKRTDGGNVVLRAGKSGNDMSIEIEDNGSGITPERLEEILDRIRFGNTSNESAEDNGYINNISLTQPSDSEQEQHLPAEKYSALRNVNLRLCLSYGPEYALKITSVCGQGTKVVINIPMDGYRQPGTNWQ